MFGLALHNLWDRKARLVSTALSVILGVAFLAGSMVLVDTLGRAFDDLIGDINEGTDVVVRSEELLESGFESSRARIDESLIDVVRSVEGVAAVAPDIQGYAQLVDQNGDAVGDPANGAPTLGFNWIDEQALTPMAIVDGVAPVELDEIVINKEAADDNNFAVGDTVTVLLQVAPEQFTISGIATFGESDSLLGSTVTLFEPETAQRVLGVPGKVSQIGIAGTGELSQEELRANIAAAMPDGIEAITGEQSTAEAQDDIAEALGFFNTFMTAFALIALFVAAFIIYNTFSIIVAQRTKETALLRALGAGRSQVISSVVIEAVAIGLIASLLGLLGGLGVAVALKAVLAAVGLEVPASGVVFAPSTAYAAFIVGVGITTVSALIPAFRASRIAPMAALRESTTDNSGWSRPRMIFGAAVLTISLAALFTGLFADVGTALQLIGLGAAGVFVGVAALGPVVARPFTRLAGAPVARLRGLPGELAQENGLRNPKRTATTAAALMVGVGLVSAISIFASSTKSTIDGIIDDSVVGDLIIDSGVQDSFGGLSPELAAEVNELAEVDLASGVRRGLTKIDGDTKSLLAFDTENMEQLVDVDIIEGDPALLGLDGLAVLDDVADDRGWTLGTPVEVLFADTGAQTFDVGVIYTKDTLVGDMFISSEAFEANNETVLDFAIYILRNPDVSPEQARLAVEAVTASYPSADVQNLDDVKASVGEQIDQMLTLVYALLALAVLIALIGIANTLRLSILERTREIGLLRALGMTRAQLRAMVRWESFLVALLGTVLGLLLGLFFGWSMVQALRDEGITDYAVPVVQLLIIVVIGTAAGVFASLRPASRAAKLAILDATRSE